MSQHYTVNTFRDAEAGVLVATSDDIPGLVTEADTLEALVAKLKVMVPELLELNRIEPAGIARHYRILVTVACHTLATLSRK